jgi:hypothetical protein
MKKTLNPPKGRESKFGSIKEEENESDQDSTKHKFQLRHTGGGRARKSSNGHWMATIEQTPMTID